GACSQALPDVPTVTEFVPGYESSGWYGVAAPKNTPAEIVDKLNKEINAALADPKLKARLVDIGGTTLAGPPPDFRKLIADENQKGGKVVRAAHIKAEGSATFHNLPIRECSNDRLGSKPAVTGALASGLLLRSNPTLQDGDPVRACAGEPRRLDGRWREWVR